MPPHADHVNSSPAPCELSTDYANDSMELAFESSIANSYLSLDRTLAENEIAVFIVNPDGSSETVIERTNNVLTHTEVLKHMEDCKKAILEELGRWNKHKAWGRMPRSKAKNLLTSKWVLKWKGEGKDRKIKARLTVQGFKDSQQDINNYSATTSRWGQRLVLLIAAQMKWTLWAADVSEAFLRGLTFKELAESPGETLRSVQLILPPGANSLLRQLPGFEDFDEVNEILDMHKPGYGLKDAPRLWNLALKRVLARLNLKPTTCDEQLFVKHLKDGKDSNGNPRLVLILSTHVDDLKLAGEDAEVKEVLRLLEAEFDALKIEKGTFEHCGVKHKQNEDFSIDVSQQHYAEQLRPMNVQHLKISAKDAKLVAQDYSSFRSLLGGVAWMTQTRPDVAVYISYLQRNMDSPEAQHAIDLNRVLRYIKRKPLTITYRAVDKPWRMIVISDSAFQSKDQDCLALRSGLIALAGQDDLSGKAQVQPLEHVCKKQNHVCRSTYAAELHSSLDLLGLALLMNQTVTEVLLGPMTPPELLECYNNGEAALKIDLYIDAKAVFDSVTARTVRTPADKILLLHALALRHHLDRQQVRSLNWIDTRDMVADALNKGIIDRSQLRDFFQKGIWHRLHESRSWSAALSESHLPIMVSSSLNHTFHDRC